MDLISILVDCVSGAIAGVSAYLLVRNPRQRRIAFVMTFVISLAVVNQLARRYVTPRLRAWNASRSLESVLSDIPVYQVIAKHEPDAYADITMTMRSSLARGETSAQAASRGKALMSKLVARHLPRASDRAVVAYMNVILQEMTQLAKVDPVACYDFLYPQGGISVELSKHVDKQTLEADLNALAEIIRSSPESPLAPSVPDHAQNLLEPVYEHLGRQHGEDLVILQNPQQPGVDKRKVCEMITAFYSKILELPEEESGYILRYLLSAQ